MTGVVGLGPDEVPQRLLDHHERRVPVRLVRGEELRLAGLVDPPGQLRVLHVVREDVAVFVVGQVDEAVDLDLLEAAAALAAAARGGDGLAPVHQAQHSNQ